MPIHTIIRPEFGEAVRAALRGLSPNQAAYKTSISDEYIRNMAGGKVPSEAIIARFAEGLGADLQTLRIAAGYAQEPADALLQDVILELRGKTLSEADRDLVLDAVRRGLADLERIRKKESP